jgi:hypothetical protein
LRADSAGEQFRSGALGITNDVRIMVKRDLGTTVAHHPCNDVDGCSGFEEFRCNPVPEAVDPNVHSIWDLDAELRDCSMNTIFHDVV